MSEDQRLSTTLTERHDIFKNLVLTEVQGLFGIVTDSLPDHYIEDLGFRKRTWVSGTWRGGGGWVGGWRGRGWGVGGAVGGGGQGNAVGGGGIETIPTCRCTQSAEPRSHRRNLHRFSRMIKIHIMKLFQSKPLPTKRCD